MKKAMISYFQSVLGEGVQQMITKRFMMIGLICLTITVIAVVITGSTALAQQPSDSVKNFYKGKTITIHCGIPGTVPDIFSRLYGEYLSKELGAKLIVNAYSEIGGLESMNIAYKAKPDGLTLGCHDTTSIVHNGLLGEPVARYDLEKFVFIGAMGSSKMALWVKAGGKYDSLEDLRAGKGLLLAAASPLGYFAFWGSFASHVLNLDFKSVLGIGGPFQVKLSVLQGKTDYCNIMTMEPGLQPELKPLVMVSFERDELIPDVPTLAEVVKMTDAQKDQLTLCNKVTQFMPLLALPPGVPEDRVTYLRNFTAGLASNSDFLGQLKKLFGFAAIYDGNYVEKEIRYLIDHKPELNELKALVKSYYK
jgi:hypothetical protein